MRGIPAIPVNGGETKHIVDDATLDDFHQLGTKDIIVRKDSDAKVVEREAGDSSSETGGAAIVLEVDRY